MAIKIVLKGTAGLGGMTTPDWYRHETENLAGVTNLPSNSALGLEQILIFPPTEPQLASGMVCAVILKTIIGDVRATVYNSKNSPGTLYLRPPQSKEEDEESGEVKYHDEVKMTSKLIAQVLRHIETMVDVVNDEEQGTTGAGEGAIPNVGLENSIPAGNVDQHAPKPGLTANNPFAGIQA